MRPRVEDGIKSRLSKQETLVQSLLAQNEQVQGSVFSRFGRCGKPGCPCEREASHGPYYVLTSRTNGRNTFRYLTPQQARLAKSLVSRHRRFRRGLTKLRGLNTGLETLLRRYAKAATKRGAQRLDQKT